jgi:hypothetical protein
VAQNDLRLAARLCQLFDARAQVWQDDDSSSAAAATRRKMKFDLPEGVAVVSVGFVMFNRRSH